MTMRKKKNGIMGLKIVGEMLQKSLSMAFSESDNESSSETIKGGHFAVIAMENERPKRFFVHLSYLNDPAFLTLLEHAAEEFGFVQRGALCVPCSWSDMESILARK
ncbi:hypothetical protein SLEP1_g42576 [Rubroshorea leprosula]|uniref:Small auxin up regulated protein n=1 Tax=Rubroshorea leprosula TaxID=152421 RepID=A0AAV5LAQ7_9ROSI|nr:hypothetical protein SLEP1_g42576 [Rubroshorea leprosula]